jgi:hypothetical protein
MAEDVTPRRIQTHHNCVQKKEARSKLKIQNEYKIKNNILASYAKKAYLNLRDEVAGGWRKLHNEGLHNLYPPTTLMARNQG